MKLLTKLRAFFSGETLDAEMTEEMRLHLEQRTRARIADRLSPGEARFAVLRKFGGVEPRQREWHSVCKAVSALCCLLTAAPVPRPP